ncbi:MAG: hypothetical protein GY910_12025 [bacterium]|nr:hypothetical protein [bacterium]
MKPFRLASRLAIFLGLAFAWAPPIAQAQVVGLESAQLLASAGSAYVFTRDATTGVWTEQAQLLASDLSDCCLARLLLSRRHKDTLLGDQIPAMCLLV